MDGRGYDRSPPYINIIIVNMIIVVLAVTKYPSTSDTCKTCEKLQWAKPDRHQGRRTCACHPVFPSPQSQRHTYRCLPLLSVTLLLAAHVHVHNPMQRIEARWKILRSEPFTSAFDSKVQLHKAPEWALVQPSQAFAVGDIVSCCASLFQ